VKKIPETGPPHIMDINNLITEDDIIKAMWLQLAEYGVFIDNIDDEGNVYFTVPKKSDYMIKAQQFIPGVGVSAGATDMEMSGEFLRAFANGFFENYGLIPHGGIRDNDWSQLAGQVRVQQEKMDIDKGGPQLLRL